MGGAAFALVDVLRGLDAACRVMAAIGRAGAAAAVIDARRDRGRLRAAWAAAIAARALRGARRAAWLALGRYRRDEPVPLEPLDTRLPVLARAP